MVLNTAKAVSSIKLKQHCHNDKKQQQKLQQRSQPKQHFQIKSSWKATNCGKSRADLPGHFSSVCRFGIILQAVAFCQTEMKSDAFSLVDKSRVNRDFGVAEASFNLKLELVSQTLTVWNRNNISQDPETTYKHTKPVSRLLHVCKTKPANVPTALQKQHEDLI